MVVTRAGMVLYFVVSSYLLGNFQLLLLCLLSIYQVPTATDDENVLQRVSKHLFGSFHIGKHCFYYLFFAILLSRSTCLVFLLFVND